jgi:hypothetical protein
MAREPRQHPLVAAVRAELLTLVGSSQQRTGKTVRRIVQEAY